MRRWILRIFVCLFFLIGGAITTVAVAWGCAAWVPLGLHITDTLNGTTVSDTLPNRSYHIYRSADGSTADACTEYDAFGRTRFIWILDGQVTLTGDSSFFISRAPAMVYDLRFTGRPEELSDAPVRWSAFRNRRSANAAATWFAIEDGAGWPWRSLHGFSTAPAQASWLTGSAETTNLIKIQDVPNGPSLFRTFRALPLRPIVPGFVIDTLFYAAIWGGVFFGFTSAKRGIRRRRGRCPVCGYDLRGQRATVGCEPLAVGSEGYPKSQEQIAHSDSLGCPECGWNRPTENGRIGCDMAAYWKSGGLPWTFFAYPTSLADPSGLPPDDDAKRLLKTLQTEGLEVGVWSNAEWGGDSTYFACSKNHIQKVTQRIKELESNGELPSNFCLSRTEYLMSLAQKQS